MKKVNVVKKFMSIMLAASMALSITATAASASSNIVFLDPQDGDISTSNTTYITQDKDENGVITGRTIDASGITASTTLANTHSQNFLYRNTVIDTTSGNLAIGGGSSRFKNNFVWEFDFCFDQIPATDGDSGCFYIQLGSNWQNTIKFYSKTSSTDSTYRRYYVAWGGGSTDQSQLGISFETDPYWIGSSYMLQEGKTYHLKIEADLRSATPKIYTTFTNPYITYTDEGTVQLNETPAAEGVKVYTKTTSNLYDLGFTQSTLDEIQNAQNRVNVSMVAKSAAKVVTSNEKFSIDKFWNTTPELTLDGNTLTAETNSINITSFAFYTYAPSLLCAVYKEDGELAAYNMTKPWIAAMEGLSDNIYSTSVDLTELEDGTYTVKAFVWNSTGKMQPYDNCLASKTLTVADGTPAFAE